MRDNIININRILDRKIMDYFTNECADRIFYNFVYNRLSVIVYGIRNASRNGIWS